MSEFYNEFVTRIATQKAAWLAAKARQEAEAPALTQFTHIVVDPGFHYALHQEGGRFTPVVIRPVVIHPEGSKFTIWSRETAEEIAAARGDGYQAIPLRELPGRKLAALNSMLKALIGESAAITL